MSAFLELLPDLILLAVLLVLSGFFSGAETALFSLNRGQVKRMADGARTERTVTALLAEPQRLLSTILVGNMFVNVLLASIVASLMDQFLPGRGVWPALLVSTFLLLIFGEVTPKTIAVHHNLLSARLAAVPLFVFSVVIKPIRILLRLVTHLLLALIGQRRVPGWDALTPEQMAAMVEACEAVGATDERERELIERILNLDAIDARDIMVPRTEVVGVSDALTVGEAYDTACRKRHSRLPIYHEDLDDIWGLISVVDLSRWQGTDTMDRVLADLRPENGAAEWSREQSPVYPAYVVPETAKVESLITTMQELRTELIVIVDEYGGTAGILTLEDALEEVVGQISPAEQEDGKDFVVAEDGILVDGRTHIRDLNRELQLDLPQNGTDTIGGYAMELLGRLPRAGDLAQDEHCRFHVIKMAGRRVGALRIERMAPAEEEDAAP